MKKSAASKIKDLMKHQKKTVAPKKKVDPLSKKGLEAYFDKVYPKSDFVKAHASKKPKYGEKKRLGEYYEKAGLKDDFVKKHLKNRSFCITWYSGMEKTDGKVCRGRYTGSHSRAALKFVRELNRDLKTKKNDVLVVVRETTQGSKKKEQGYRVTRKKLAKPQVIEKGGVSFKINYATSVKKDVSALVKKNGKAAAPKTAAPKAAQPKKAKAAAPKAVPKAAAPKKAKAAAPKAKAGGMTLRSGRSL